MTEKVELRERPVYEAPQLVGIGSLHELTLQSKTGRSSDVASKISK